MNNTIRANLSGPSIRWILSKPIISSSTPSCFSLLAAPRIELRRRYHSYQHPAPAPPFTAAELAILSASLLHVPSHGFSDAALSFGARDAGYLDISVNMLSRGVFDLVRYHLATERLRLGDKIDFRKPENESPESLRNLNVPAKIRVLCMERLKANVPIIHRWQEVHSPFFSNYIIFFSFSRYLKFPGACPPLPRSLRFPIADLVEIG